MDKTKSAWHWITALCVALMMFTGTLTSSGFSVMVNAVKEYVEMTGTQSSLIFTIKNISALVFVVFADKYYKVMGLRKGVTGGLLLGAVAMTVFMLADKNIFMIYLAAILAGATYAFAMLLPLALINKNWFNKSRPLAMAIASAGTGLNAMIITPHLQRLVTNTGVASAFAFEIGMFVVAAIVFFIFVRDTPEERGLEPYGGKDYAVAAAKGKGSGLTVARNWTIIFIALAGIQGFIGGPTQQYLILHFNQLGYDPAVVAAAYGILGGTLIVTKLCFGAVSSKFNFGYVSAFFYIAYLVTCFACISAQFTMASWAPLLACIGVGIGGPVISLGYPNWVADTQPENYAKTAKTAQTAYQLVEILGSFIPGVILDVTGHYTGFYMLNAVGFAITAILVFIAYRQAAANKKKAALEAEAAEIAA